MKVRFDSDNYVRRTFTGKAIIIKGIYVGKILNGKKGSLFGCRLCK